MSITTNYNVYSKFTHVHITAGTYIHIRKKNTFNYLAISNGYNYLVAGILLL